MTTPPHTEFYSQPTVEASPTLSAPAAHLARTRGPLLVAMFLAAIFSFAAWNTQRLFFQDASFAWAEQIDVIWRVLQKPWFFLLVLVAWALGRSTRVREVAPPRLRLSPRRALVVALLSSTIVGATALALPAFAILDLASLWIASAALLHAVEFRFVWLRAAEAFVSLVVFLSISYSFTIFKSTLFLSSGPMDSALLSLETKILGLSPAHALAGLIQNSSWTVWFLDGVYFRLFDVLFLVPLFLVSSGARSERDRYLLAVVLAYTCGVFCYRLFPSVGPRFVDPETWSFLMTAPGRSGPIGAFLATQTILVTEGRAEKLFPYSYLAAMPSLHIAQVTIATWTVRRSPIALAMACFFSLATAVATLALGWHYLLDVVGGLALGCFCLWIARAVSLRMSTPPASSSPSESVP